MWKFKRYLQVNLKGMSHVIIVSLLVVGCSSTGQTPGSESSIGTAGFKGKIAESYADSQEWWPEADEPPKESPNIIIFLLDDVGFAQFGSFECLETGRSGWMDGKRLRYTPIVCRGSST